MKQLNEEFIKNSPNPETLSTLKNQYISNNPFPHIVIDDMFKENILDSTVKGIKKFNNIKDDVWYKLCTLGSDFSAFGKEAQGLMNYLISSEWVDFMSKLTGIEGLTADPEWEGAGINFEPRGSHLELHTDFNQKRNGTLGWRRVNALLFLSKDWQNEWGGQNELWNKDLSECVVSSNPEFNRLVVFTTSDISWHGFPPVVCPEDRSRKVISCYYYHPEDKGEHSYSKVHTTYRGWGKGRNFEGRTGTGFKEI